jgi:hypothetical protein
VEFPSEEAIGRFVRQWWWLVLVLMLVSKSIGVLLATWTLQAWVGK